MGYGLGGDEPKSVGDELEAYVGRYRVIPAIAMLEGTVDVEALRSIAREAVADLPGARCAGTRLTAPAA